MANEYDHFNWFDPNVDYSSNAINDIVLHLKAEIVAAGEIRRWQERYSEHIRLVVLNLYNTALIDPTMYVAYSRNKNTYYEYSKSRYIAFKPLFSSMIIIIDSLKKLGYIEGAKGFNFRQIQYSRTAKMKSTKALLHLCNTYQLNPYDISSNSAEEVIILKTKDHTGRKILTEYTDTADTIKMRENLNTINNKIASQFIGLNVCDDTFTDINKAILGMPVNDCAAFDDFDNFDDFNDAEDVEDVEQDGGSKGWNSDKLNYSPYLDLSKIKLKRIFNNGSFMQGGRFYGGWWQAIPSRYRPYIAIDDQQTVEVDFCGIHINLLYLKEKLPLPTDDVYTIEGLPAESRKVLKVALQILLNSRNEGIAIRSIKRKFPATAYPRLFEVVSHEQVIEAFKDKHGGIAHHFYKGVGVYLQFIDSEIAEQILLDLVAKNIVVLPVHDSFIVRKDHVETLKATMRDVVYRRFGQTLNLKQDKTAYDLDMDTLIREVSHEDLPLSHEEYEREWQSANRGEYLRRRNHWYSERNL